MGASSEEKRRLARLGPGLEARKRSDQATFAAAQADCDRIEAEIAALEDEIRGAAAALDASDLAASAYFERWRGAVRGQIAKLDYARATAAAILEERRAALLRSNGEVEALKRLLS